MIIARKSYFSLTQTRIQHNIATNYMNQCAEIWFFPGLDLEICPVAAILSALGELASQNVGALPAVGRTR